MAEMCKLNSEEYVSHQGADKLVDMKSFRFRFMATVLRIFVKILRLDVDEKSRLREAVGGNRSGSYSLRQFWPECIFILYTLCSLHLLTYLSLKIFYDFNLLHSNELIKKIKLSESLKNLTANAEQIIHMRKLKKETEANIEASQYIMNILGGFDSQINFVVDHFLSTVIIAGVFGYLLNMINFRSRSRYVCCSVQDLVDYEGEQLKSHQMVETLVAEWQRSWEVFFQSLGYRHELHLTASSTLKSRLRMRSDHMSPLPNHFSTPKKALLSGGYSMKHLSQNRELVARQLEDLKLSGALRPMNKLTEWIELRLRSQFKYYICMMITNFSITLFMLTLVVSGSKSGRHFQEGETQSSVNLVVAIDVVGIMVPAVIGFTFYEANTIIHSMDIVKLARETLAMVNFCVQMNSRLFDQYGRLPPESIRALMNRNLMLAFAHYKLFVAQMYCGILKSFDVFLPLLMVLILVPLITRLLLPLMLDDHISRIHALSMCVAALRTCDMTTLPVCFSNACCMRLYKSLSNLLAHTVEVNEIVGQVSSARRGHKFESIELAFLYDEHTISLLRKELELQHHAGRRFEARVFSVSCTYPAICRVHFWFGLLFISIMVGERSSSGQLLSVISFKV